jgi:N-methylhydantoinase B/oxoprolinase/acetone carboxylase alpha subunit
MSAPHQIDGIQLAILTARLDGIARKMANTLHRTGRSGILTIARDFSCVVLTAHQMRLLFQEASRHTISRHLPLVIATVSARTARPKVSRGADKPNA